MYSGVKISKRDVSQEEDGGEKWCVHGVNGKLLMP